MSRKYYENLANRESPADSQPMSELYGMPAAEIARKCEVDLATARRWKSGKSRIPPSARKLLAGDLSAFDPDWRGWVMRDGKLTSPEGWTYSPGEVLSLMLLRAQIAHLESLRRRERELEEQPEPGALPTRAVG